MTDTGPSIGRIVIIDDSEFDQLMYRRLIDRSGMVGDLVTFLSGEDALAYFTRDDATPVDVILLDINMPGMNGFEFLESATRRLGPDFARIVIFMLTTSLNPRDIARAEASEVVKDYLNKPLEAEHLTRIARFLENRDRPAA